ncbi:YidB family protein [Sulfurovum sp. zt1-1]|uniref:YidB family protein n=1 Tax=Sulfurovum zhangzhouensis TaxID=3019067 RepID=A0ABT7QWG1_9BACT|nr:YidB family protein [Sulfurovum zhangzhouensis]MDM5271167.1 YidB family protein [Sulfurovum zhangzhouensis]
MELFRTGARFIEASSDNDLPGFDIDEVASALSNMFSHQDGTLDLSPIMIGLSKSGLSDIVNSWMGNGINLPILPEQIVTLLGEERVSRFADELGISQESAASALAKALPKVVDQATGGSDSIVDEMIGQAGSSQGAMELLSKMFR